MITIRFDDPKRTDKVVTAKEMNMGDLFLIADHNGMPHLDEVYIAMRHTFYNKEYMLEATEVSIDSTDVDDRHIRYVKVRDSHVVFLLEGEVRIILREGQYGLDE